MSVSWLIPVRNARPWLAECLASVIHTCGPSDQIVVVNDGSIDDPKAVCPKDARLTWLDQPPLGISQALEAGRRECIHPFIARMDADDITLPGRLKRQLALLERDPGLAAVGGRADLFRDDDSMNEGMQRYVTWVNGLVDLHASILVESPLFHPAVLMRAEALASVGGYRAGSFPEDYDLWLRFLTAGYRLASVPDTVVRIRDRPGRLTRTDERYRLDAFDGLKKDWLKSGILRATRRLALWGAGKTGRRWLRWFLGEGHEVVAVVDPFSGRERQGVPVVQPSALEAMDIDYIFVAVGARGARSVVREQLGVLRPDLIEGKHWWCLA